MICSSVKRFFTSNLLVVGDWTPDRGATQRWGNVDRSHQDKKDKERSERDDRFRKEEITLRQTSLRAEEFKNAMLDLMATSYEYVRHQSDYVTNLTAEAKGLANTSSETFTRSAQGVILLGDEKIEEAAIDFWNAAHRMPRNLKEPFNDQSSADLKAYQVARANLVAAAKVHLKQLESPVV